MIQKLCMPALIYLIFMVMHISFDVYYGFYNMVLIKIGIATIGTLLLNVLCENNMSIVSWMIIFIPFVMMTIIAVYILMMLGLNPATGKSNVEVSKNPPNAPPSIYANPVSVNTPYYGKLANSIRAVQSNYS
jgi:hypothetical protein